MTPIDALYAHAQNRPSQAAMVAGNRYWTYSKLVGECERLAKAMLARGVKPGDRVALHMTNVPEIAIAYYACFRIGAIAAPLNIRMKTAELEPILKLMAASLYLGQAQLYGEIAGIETDILPSHVRYVVGGSVKDERARPWERIYAGSANVHLPAMPDPDAPAVLLGTSGTTGASKLVVHTATTLGATTEAFIKFGLHGRHRMLNMVPMVHCSGLGVMLGSIRFGARMILLERFDPDAALDAIAANRCTWVIGLPFMYADMVQCQSMHPRNVASLKYCLSGGDACPMQVQNKFADVFRLPLYSTWAATEIMGALIHGLQPGPVSRMTSPDDVRLVDDNGAPVRRGAVGELLIRAPQLTPGYWTGPDRIEVAAPDGWYRTGDLMRQGDKDDLWFVARKKDLIIRGGSNISPLEVEHVLLSHPAVYDAAVVGVPDQRLGQRVAAVVQLVPGADNEVLDDILDYARARLADYKVPERLHVFGKIPRNGVGKIDRKTLVVNLADAERQPLRVHA
jgi:long-chain acyl-CoA synthetase